MSEFYHNRISIKASKVEARNQLQEFVQAIYGEQKLANLSESIVEHTSINERIDERNNYFKYKWYYLYQGHDAKIISESPDALVVEYISRNGGGMSGMESISKQYPDLLFSCLYYLYGEEGAIECQNGDSVDHFYDRRKETEITSNEFQDYAKYSVLTPKDPDGNPYPFDFLVVGSNKIIVSFTEIITLIQGRKVLGAEQYMRFFEMNLLKLRVKKLIGLPINYGREENSIEYSIMLNCSKVDEAIAESLKIMKEFHKPVDDFINKAIEIAKVDFNMKPEHFEFPKVELPIRNNNPE